MCMSCYEIASIRKNFMEEGNLVDANKVKINSKLVWIRATRKLQRFYQINFIQYIDRQNLKIGMELCVYKELREQSEKHLPSSPTTDLTPPWSYLLKISSINNLTLS